MEFNDAIEWPNGEGYTPCSKEYADLVMSRDAIFDPAYDAGTTEDLSPEDYQRWHDLQHKLDALLASGRHVGKSQRY